jgi:hypothetical protein
MTGMSRIDVAIDLRGLLLALAAYAMSTFALVAFCAVSRQQLPAGVPTLLGTSAFVLLLVASALGVALRRGRRLPPGSWSLAILVGAVAVLALAALYQIAAYLEVPVDLLSFSESPFVNDILKLRLGTPVYTPVPDNNSYPYTPGAQILTYAVSAALGYPESIPVYRAVQFSFVVLAAVIATSICDLLARQLLSPAEYRQRALWIAVWLPWLFLVSIDPRFNPYNHSLHNDGLALLFSMAAFWMMARYAMRPGPVLFWVMAIWPALGFLVKQSQMIWLVVFCVYFVVLGGTPWRRLALFLLCGAAAWGATIALCFLLWDRPFLHWVFGALGEKQVSVFRSVLHLREAGLYACMGLVAGGMLVRANPSRPGIALWVAWLLVLESRCTRAVSGGSPIISDPGSFWAAVGSS